MNRYVAFLRGMNLGRRRIKNPELCAAFEQIGFTNVSAFLASGNIVFDAEDSDPIAVSRSIEYGLRASLGYEVPTFLRTADEVSAIASYKPFADVTNERTGKLQVAIINSELDQSARDSVLRMSNEADMLEMTGKELYWLPQGNLLDSQLDLKAIEEIVGPFTVRTKNTVERLAAKLLAE